MQITYHGFAYEVYTVNDGDIGCTAVNINPNAQRIDDAKREGCGAEVTHQKTFINKSIRQKILL